MTLLIDLTFTVTTVVITFSPKLTIRYENLQFLQYQCPRSKHRKFRIMPRHVSESENLGGRNGGAPPRRCLRRLLICQKLGGRTPLPPAPPPFDTCLIALISDSCKGPKSVVSGNLPKNTHV